MRQFFLRDQGIDNNEAGVGRVRRACGLNNDDRRVSRGQGIDDTSEGLETTAEAARARRRARGIYDDNEVVGWGRWERIIKQRQQRLRRRIDSASKVLEKTTETAADLRQARWIGNNNRVLIFLAIASLKVKLSCLCIVNVSFFFFHQIPFFLFTAINTISTAITRKIFLHQMYTNLAYVPPTYRRVKKTTSYHDQ